MSKLPAPNRPPEAPARRVMLRPCRRSETLQQCRAQPLPHTPHQGPPSPAKNSTTGLTLHAHTTPSFLASSRAQTTDVEVVPHRALKAGIFNPPAYMVTMMRPGLMDFSFCAELISKHGSSCLKAKLLATPSHGMWKSTTVSILLPI